MSMITAAQWVPRGFAAPFPQKYTLDEAEYERIAELAQLQLDDAEEDLKEAQDDEGDDDAMVDDAPAKGSKKKSKSETKYVPAISVCVTCANCAGIMTTRT